MPRRPLLLAPPRYFGLYEALCGTASTYGDVLEVASRYSGLFHTGARLSHTVRGDVLHVRNAYSDSSGEPDRHINECTVGSLVIMARACTGRPMPVQRVYLPHAAPEQRKYVEVLERFFGTRRLEFGVDHLGFEVHAESLGWAGLAAAPRLHRLLREYADQLLGALTARSSLLGKVRVHLMGELREGRASLEGVAARMRLDPRALQRRLEAEGTTYSALLEVMRRELAMTYLKSGDVELSEVAYRLGFTSPQSFSRAFRAWTGVPPGRWRRSQPERT